MTPRIRFQYSERTNLYPPRVFFALDANEELWCPSGAMLTDQADMELVAKLRAFADRVEKEITVDARKQAIEDRIKAEMEAEGAV